VEALHERFQKPDNLSYLLYASVIWYTAKEMKVLIDLSDSA
jgi:hypothetical protein